MTPLGFLNPFHERLEDYIETLEDMFSVEYLITLHDPRKPGHGHGATHSDTHSLKSAFSKKSKKSRGSGDSDSKGGGTGSIMDLTNEINMREIQTITDLENKTE